MRTPSKCDASYHQLFIGRLVNVVSLISVLHLGFIPSPKEIRLLSRRRSRPHLSPPPRPKSALIEFQMTPLLITLLAGKYLFWGEKGKIRRKREKGMEGRKKEKNAREWSRRERRKEADIKVLLCGVRNSFSWTLLKGEEGVKCSWLLQFLRSISISGLFYPSLSCCAVHCSGVRLLRSLETDGDRRRREGQERRMRAC